jgi:hypothetical protein
MNSFVCATCGDTHEGLPTDHGWRLPDVVWAIPEERRSTEAKFNSDLCQFGGRFFIRAVLKLPFNEQPGFYAWGPWVELQEPDFYRYVELYDKDGTDEPMVSGTLANEIPSYQPTLGLPVMVQFQNSTSRPTLKVAAGHQLADEQTRGIDNRRYHEILVATGSLGGP